MGERWTLNNSSQSIEALVTEAIHEAIMGFDPESPDSYDLHTRNLESLEEDILKIEDEDLRTSLLTRTRACIIGMAHDAERSLEVIRRSEDFLRLCPFADPNFVTVSLFKIAAFHHQGLHDEEIQSALTLAREGTIQGESLPLMLERIVRIHPEALSWDEGIASRLQEFFDSRPDLVEGIERPSKSMGLGTAILALASKIRENNRISTERSLSRT